MKSACLTFYKLSDNEESSLLNNRQTRMWGGHILMNKETITGFYSPSVGSSSAIGIRLEKEVKLPIKYISEIMLDSAYEYPLNEIFNSTWLWDNGRITYMSQPNYFRIEIQKYGLTPVRKNIRTGH